MAEAAPVFHFIFGLRPQPEPMHVVHYLCLESCRRVNRPRAICLHYRHEPHGAWWERIKPHLCLRPVDKASFIPDVTRYETTAEGRLIRDAGWIYAHEADFLRVALLLEEGGVYADIDTLFVRPLPTHLFARAFVLGEEAPVPGSDGVLRPSLCNALILAQPGAAFARSWQAAMAQAFDGTWSRHSCQLAVRLWADMPQTLHVVPQPYFYKHAATPRGVRALLEGFDPDVTDVYSLHLWAHLWWDAWRTDFATLHADALDVDYLRRARSTYAVLARPFLD